MPATRTRSTSVVFQFMVRSPPPDDPDRDPEQDRDERDAGAPEEPEEQPELGRHVEVVVALFDRLAREALLAEKPGERVQDERLVRAGLERVVRGEDRVARDDEARDLLLLARLGL